MDMGLTPKIVLSAISSRKHREEYDIKYRISHVVGSRHRIMNELPPIPRDQRKIDADHLHLLSIFHFVAAGLGFLGVLFICVHFAFFHVFFSNPRMWENQKSGPPPAELFVFFKLLYLLFGGWFLSSVVLNLISAFCLRARKHRTFSLVVAGINCLHIPVGTVLGVFTMVVLVRESVRELYDS